MKENFKFAIGVASSVFLMTGVAYSQNMLQKYLDASVSIIPNTIDVSLYEEVKYNDNIHNAPKNTQDSVIFKTGATADFYRTKGNLTYGLSGEASYDWYTKDSDDLSHFNWNLAPYLQGNFGDKLLQGLMISLKSRSVYEPYSKTDTRYVRHYENGIGLAYDYSRSERWGVVSTFQYMNYYYPQGKYNYSSTTHNTYNFSIAPYYVATEKIRTGLHLSYEIVDYKDAKKYDDSTSLKVAGFVDYRANMFLSMTGEAGMERMAYDGDSRGSVNDRDFEPYFSYTLRYVPARYWAVTYILRYEPEYGSDIGRGQRQAWNNRLTLSWDATAKINVSQTVGFDMNDEKNSADDTNEVTYSLRVNYKVLDNLTVYGGYEYDDVHFKYRDDADYHSNEFLVGLRWKL